MRTNCHARSRAFSLVELMVVLGLSALVGGIAYVVLNTGLVLFAKNTATNVSHQQARMAMLQMQREMYQAVSPTQLVDEDGKPVNGAGPAAGISFHVFAAGPFPVTAEAKSGQNKIAMNLGNFVARSNDRLVIANHELEIDLNKGTVGSGVQVLELAEPIPYTVAITEKNDRNDVIPKPVYGLITARISYRIKDGNLLYQDQSGVTTVLAREITSEKPFVRSAKGNSVSNPRFTATINLSTGYGNGKGKGNGPKKGKFKTSSVILNAEVPARAVLCTKP